MELIPSHFSDHMVFDCSDRSKYEIIEITKLYNILPKLITYVKHNEFNNEFFKELRHIKMKQDILISIVSIVTLVNMGKQ